MASNAPVAPVQARPKAPMSNRMAWVWSVVIALAFFLALYLGSLLNKQASTYQVPPRDDPAAADQQ